MKIQLVHHTINDTSEYAFNKIKANQIFDHLLKGKQIRRY